MCKVVRRDSAASRQGDNAGGYAGDFDIAMSIPNGHEHQILEAFMCQIKPTRHGGAKAEREVAAIMAKLGIDTRTATRVH